MRPRRLRSKLRYQQCLKAWWFWLLATWVAYAMTIGLLRFLLHDYIIVSVVHEDGPKGGKVVLYLSVVTEFASGVDRVIVVLGRSLLDPELAIEGWIRTVLVRAR
jgi:hypothetical protein